MIYADTEGLIDRCHCGAVAGFEESDETRIVAGHELRKHRARCAECEEQTMWHPFKFQSVQDWNLARRAELAVTSLTDEIGVKGHVSAWEKTLTNKRIREHKHGEKQ